jgi:kynurenine 3-monooxygenase
MARTAIIIGAGLGGSLLAHFLGQRGWYVRVFERRGDPRAAGYVGGRSINLAISARGLHALERAGLDAEVRANGIRMPGRMLHSPAGDTAYIPYSADPNRAIVSFSRSALNMMLLRAAAAHPTVEFHFGHRCTGIDESRGAAAFELADGTRTEATADLVVGADGAFSAMRRHLERRERFEYSQTSLAHGYKELTIPPVAAGPHAPFAMEPNALHIWPRGESMMIALPNPDGSFTCTLFWRHDGAGSSFAAVKSGADALAHFQRVYPDAVPLMPTLAEDFAKNPVGVMVTVRCSPWTRARVTLIGDAAHAIVPFYGQGANASFEDCEALADALASSATIEDALRAYESARIANANAIADMALRNFIEMRDLTGRASFKWKKKIEHALNRVMPATFVPLYDLVSFSTVPYSDAKARGAANDRAIKWIVGAAGTLATTAAAIATLLLFRSGAAS